MRRIHSLFTDFIVLMPLKVKELKVRAEEISRTSQIYAQVFFNSCKILLFVLLLVIVPHRLCFLFSGGLEPTRKFRSSFWDDDKDYDSSVQPRSVGTEAAFRLLVRRQRENIQISFDEEIFAAGTDDLNLALSNLTIFIWNYLFICLCECSCGINCVQTICCRYARQSIKSV